MKTRTSQARAVCPSVRISMNWQLSVEKTVTGFGYELIECERGSQGLLRVFIDRVSGQAYDTGESEFVTVEDCEKVTRQLQYVLEVDGLDYSRLEVSSPGLDRPLKKQADYARYEGERIDLTLKLPFQGRKRYQGVLHAVVGGASEGWALHFNDGKEDQVMGFALDEVREARLVPVVNFKGRKGRAQAAAATEVPGGQEE